jgi:hypothetical protein
MILFCNMSNIVLFSNTDNISNIQLFINDVNIGLINNTSNELLLTSQTG